MSSKIKITDKDGKKFYLVDEKKDFHKNPILLTEDINEATVFTDKEKDDLVPFYVAKGYIVEIAE